MNPIDPNRLRPEERRKEVCVILARGIVRLQLRGREQTVAAEKFALHFSAAESGHANANAKESA